MFLGAHLRDYLTAEGTRGSRFTRGPGAAVKGDGVARVDDSSPALPALSVRGQAQATPLATTRSAPIAPDFLSHKSWTQESRGDQGSISARMLHSESVIKVSIPPAALLLGGRRTGRRLAPAQGALMRHP